MDGKLLKANIRGEGGFCLKWPIVFLLKQPPQQSDITWRMMEDKEADLRPSVRILTQGGGVSG